MSWAAWTLLWLPGLSALVGALEADNVLLGQWMVSRPIVLGPLVGALCGQPWAGAALGALLELYSLETPPVGDVVPLNGPVAAATAVLLAAGPDPVPAALAFPAGLGLGAAHARLESELRRRRFVLWRSVAEGLETAGEVRWGPLALRSVGAQAAATAVFVYAAAALGGPALAWAWARLPRLPQQALEGAFVASPWLGLAILIHALARK